MSGIEKVFRNLRFDPVPPFLMKMIRLFIKDYPEKLNCNVKRDKLENKE
jgi:hypothetical protein